MRFSPTDRGDRGKDVITHHITHNKMEENEVKLGSMSKD